jgi:hypothetical protein
MIRPAGRGRRSPHPDLTLLFGITRSPGRLDLSGVVGAEVAGPLTSVMP